MQNFIKTYRHSLILGVLTCLFVVTPIAVPVAHAGPGLDNRATSAIRGLATEEKGTNEAFNKEAATVAEYVLSLAAKLVGLSGLLLNEAAFSTVINMGHNINRIDAINVTWTAFRDLANIGLIFMLIAIGIATILQIEPYGARKLLAQLIVIALLLNFSLAITKFVIDASNLVAIQFWSQTAVNTAGPNTFDNKRVRLSEAFMDPLRIASVYEFDANAAIANPDKIAERKTVEQRVQAAQKAGQKDDTLTFSRIAAISIFGIILFLVVAFVFFAAAILLIIRFVVLMLLMILSPLAFVAMAIPATAGMAREWWSKLFGHALYAPAYFALTWVSLHVLDSPAFRNALSPTGKDAPEATFGSLILGESSFTYVFLQFVIVIVLILASLMIARNFGVRGADTVIGWGDSLRRRAPGYLWRGAWGGAVGLANATQLSQATHRWAAGFGGGIGRGEGRVGEALSALAKIPGLGVFARPILRGGQKLRLSYENRLTRDQEKLKGLRGPELQERISWGSVHEMMTAIRQRVDNNDSDEVHLADLIQFKSLIKGAGGGTRKYDVQRPDAAYIPTEFDANGDVTDEEKKKLQDAVDKLVAKMKSADVGQLHRLIATSLYEEGDPKKGYKGGSKKVAEEIRDTVIRSYTKLFGRDEMATFARTGAQNLGEFLNYSLKQVNKKRKAAGLSLITTNDEDFLQHIADYMRDDVLSQHEAGSAAYYKTQGAIDWLRGNAAARTLGPAKSAKGKSAGSTGDDGDDSTPGGGGPDLSGMSPDERRMAEKLQGEAESFRAKRGRDTDGGDDPNDGGTPSGGGGRRGGGGGGGTSDGKGGSTQSGSSGGPTAQDMNEAIRSAVAGSTETILDKFQSTESQLKTLQKNIHETGQDLRRGIREVGENVEKVSDLTRETRASIAEVHQGQEREARRDKKERDEARVTGRSVEADNDNTQYADSEDAA